jgi:PAS domain S-box-containing protein
MINKNIFREYGFCRILIWTLIVVFALIMQLSHYHKDIIETARIEASTHLELTLQYRNFVAKMGGVYAPIDKVSPNPYLTVTNRVIKTDSGETLTLLNPAYITRLVFEAMKNSTQLPVISRLTSLKNINPVNIPDAWERNALKAFEGGSYERSEVAILNDKPYLRLIRPFIITKGCLKCHGYQDYKIGDIRGGISIAVPLTQYYATLAKTQMRTVIAFVLVWAIMAAGIILSSRKESLQRQSLIESENKFRTFFENAPDAIFIANPETGVIVDANSTASLLLQIQQDRIVGLHQSQLHPSHLCEQSKEGFYSHIDNALKNKQCHPAVFTVVRSDGTEVPVEIITKAIVINSQQFIMGIFRDITERKWADEALRKATDVLFDLYDNAPCGYQSLDREGVIIRMNKTELNWLGYTADEVLGKMHFKDFMTLESAQNYDKCFLQLKTYGAIKDFEYELVRKDGTKLYVLISANSVSDTTGNYVMSRSAVYDITERKLAESKLEEERARSLSAEKQIVETQLKMLQAQIEPHFLFNTIANIISLVDTAPANAKEMLHNLTELLRVSLQRSRKNISTLAEEADLLRNYLSIFQLRIGQRLHFEMHIPEDLFNVPFPPMLLQPLVENALKHGIEPKMEGGSITIKAERTDSALRLTVTDTGLGFPAQLSGGGVGLANVRERLNALYGDKCMFTLKENKPCGVIATIEVPI